MAKPLKDAPRVLTLPPGENLVCVWKNPDVVGSHLEFLTRNEAAETCTIWRADIGMEVALAPILTIREQLTEGREPSHAPNEAVANALVHGRIPMPQPGEADATVAIDEVPDSFLVSGTEEDNL